VAQVRTIVCFGDSNTYGAMPTLARMGRHRYAPERRWPGVMRRRLGTAWQVVEEGHPSRTILRDDPIEGAHKNGLRALPICLESHMPLDVLIVMLGTNDLKHRFAATPGDVAESVEVLVRVALASEAGPAGSAPAVVLVSPPVLHEIDWYADMFLGGAAKSLQLSPLFAAVAKRTGVAFLDGGAIVEPSAVDGIHLESDGHRALGLALAKLVEDLFRP
jgi:lysophospholipase L1-like esterase